MVYFALPVAQLFLQGVDQRFLFGQALFQQEDVVRRDVVHKPVFYRAYSVTTRIKRFTAWSESPQLLPVTLDAAAEQPESLAEDPETLSISCEVTFRHGTLRFNGNVSEKLLTLLIQELKR
ncbi:hypothetical protein [Escherichia coli]|uniref:hypothetical protein n=1 Tax=Escherichia coli TaxID=562 RepID=UPI0021BBE306|nr:hypothetical protein [Escherichia coli]